MLSLQPITCRCEFRYAMSVRHFSYYPGAESIHNDNRIEIHPMEIVDVSINCYVLNS